LQQSLSSLGIDKYVNDLNYAEKRLLIIISLTQQLKETTNDFGRTIEQPANQMRILSEQWERLSRAVGNLFMPTLKAILPYLNGIVMALTEILSFVGTLLGINIDDYVADVSGVADSVLDLEDGLDGANESAKKLKQGLRGFDKLNVITTPKDTGATSGTGAGISVDIMDAFNKAFDDYNRQLTNVQMKATKIRDSILEWLGFTKEIDPVTGKVSFKYTGIKTTLKNMWTSFKNMTPLGKTLTGVFAYLFGKSIIKIITKINKLLGKTGTVGLFKSLNNPIKELLTSLNNVNLAEKNLNGGLTTATNNWAKQLSVIDRLKLTLMGTGGLKVGYTLLSSSIKSASEEGWNLSNVLGTVGGTLSNIAGGALIGSNFGALGIAIGGVTGALITLIELWDANSTKLAGEISNVNKITESTNNYTNSLKLQRDEAEKTLKTNMNVQNYYEGLYNELTSIVDENGKIYAGYEKRAEFIVGELNRAYGIEIEIVDGVIKKYNGLGDEIEKLILKKKTQILLEAKEKEYTEVLQRDYEQRQKYIEQEKNLKEAKNNSAKAQEELTKAQEEYNIATAGGITINISASKKLRDARDNLDNAKKSVNNAQEALDNLRTEVENDTAVIDEYNTLLSASVSNNSEKMEEAISKVGGKYKHTSSEIGNQIAEDIENLDYDLNVSKRITQEYYNKQMDELGKTLQTMSQKLETITPDIINGWGTMAEKSTDTFLEHFDKIPKELQQNVIDKMQEKGYEISAELQKGINEINPTITFNANTYNAENKIRTLGDLIKSVLGGGIGSSGYGGSMGGRAKGGIFANNKWHDIKMYSDGLNAGLPPVGQMFVAREKGPELVGTLGGHTAVMNNNQIVGSVSDGVARAVRSVLGTSQQPRGQQIFNIYLDEDHKLGSYTLEQLQDMAISNGEKITIG